MSVSPDGRWVAYGRSSLASPTTSTLWVRDLEGGMLREVATNDYAVPWLGPRPVWSPDGRMLAYYGVANGVLLLRVWDREAMRHLPVPPIAVSTAAFQAYQSPWWTSQGAVVLSIADSGQPKLLWEEQESDPSLARLRAELVGQRPAPSGVTVLASSALAPSLATMFAVGEEPAARTGGLVADAREVVALDVRTGATQVLARGADFTTLQVGEREGSAVAGVRDSMDALSLYVLPLPGAPPPPPTAGQVVSTTPAAGVPVDASGVPLRLLAAHIPTGQFQNFTLSPSGRFVAYMPRGSGDVVVVEIATGATRNVTASIPERTVESMDPEAARLSARFDLPAYRGKFGNGVWDAPAWTADEEALLVARIVPQRSVTVRQRVELWRVARSGASADRLVADTTWSLVDWAPCQERPLAPCVVGPQGAVLARLRTLRPGYGTDSTAYARIDPASGTVQVGRWTRTAIRGGELVAARTTGAMIGLEENAERPPELWHVPPASPTATAAVGRALGTVNPGPLRAPGVIRLLSWTSSNGDSLFALLRLPPGSADGEQVPVIMDVYPGRSGRGGALRYDGGVSRLDPLRSRGGFALLTPDLPVQFGSGAVCADFARYAVEALDAAIATGRVDPARAGVSGLSYGGYAVNCIVTHTTRFQAAMSEVGPSHVTSARALGGRGVTNVTGVWPWEMPDRMVVESPVYRLDRVATPLLLVAGKHDLGYALQSYEMYFGLLALNKPVALLAYDNAGHGDYERFPDFWPRVLAWFGTYLEYPAALRATGVEDR
ncbi:MAG: prolyl oligopeptidase family serine peptidase [Gemmatimonadales bacterium]